ncbi:MAG: hypothetical protein ACREP9_10790 [Candidatus Dormibacteraceae bacterium]
MDTNEKYMNPERYENSEYPPQERAAWPMGLPRRVRIKGREGVVATLVVTVAQGKVWLSISPPFIWEAIMEPGKIDEVISTLELARDEAQKMTTTPARNSFRGGKKATVRAITRNDSTN